MCDTNVACIGIGLELCGSVVRNKNKFFSSDEVSRELFCVGCFVDETYCAIL